MQQGTYISNPISISFKEVQMTLVIVGALFTPNVNSFTYEQTIRPNSSYNISQSNKTNTDKISTSTSTALTSKSFELDSYGIKSVEIANTDIKLSYFNAERVIEPNSYIPEKAEEAMSMYEKLIMHRDKVEHTGLVGGTLLGLATIAVPLLFDIQWQAAIPATLLFFSIPLTILYRKNLFTGGN
ncbi:hypothetical protein [Lysinibacillus sp. RC79]|uniref:hypothetical protein n=1 Tax=Lysinibacillus sp. RC79 TaxID=3156296 RepID=UPI003514B78C